MVCLAAFCAKTYCLPPDGTITQNDSDEEPRRLLSTGASAHLIHRRCDDRPEATLIRLAWPLAKMPAESGDWHGLEEIARFSPSHHSVSIARAAMRD